MFAKGATEFICCSDLWRNTKIHKQMFEYSHRSVFNKGVVLHAAVVHQPQKLTKITDEENWIN